MVLRQCGSGKERSAKITLMSLNVDGQVNYPY